MAYLLAFVFAIIVVLQARLPADEIVVRCTMADQRTLVAAGKAMFTFKATTTERSFEEIIRTDTY
jgi:hypothetical protein